MKLTPPTKNVFYISAILAIAGILGEFGILVPEAWGHWLLIVGYVLLFLGNTMKGF